MIANKATIWAAIVCGLLLCFPAAGALSWGVDAASANGVKNAGATPAFGQTWVGTWMKTSGWGGFESDLRAMQSSGITPVIMWYYWGDAISPSCVNNGCNGMSKGEWDSMARDMTTRAKAIMGSATFYVVLEPEFNKQGVESMEAFDGYLADQANAIRSIAPSVKIVTGFGSWGGYDIFDRAVAASDLTGFQYMRASTRHTAADAMGAADSMIGTATTLHAKFGKGVLVFDLAIGTYGGWESVQKTALENIGAKSQQLASAGVVGIVWRYVYDNTYSYGYFGAAESTWGVKYANGATKPGWDALVALVKGGTVSAAVNAPPPAPELSAPAPTAPSSAFSAVSGNEWWIQANVAGAPTSVTASVSNGATVAMPKQPWGAYAVSTHATSGSVVTIRATFADGSVASSSYAWPSATPTSAASASAPAPAPAAASSAGFSPAFTNAKGNAWWIQVDVNGANVASVDASVNGGAWTKLPKQAWGSYAASIHAVAGSKVQFRATSATGQAATSATTTW